MALNSSALLDEVKTVLVETLAISDRAASIDANTELLGNLPELDSMAVLELVAALEQQFGIAVDDEDVTAEVFETLGSLTTFVAEKRN
ncbi:phosphopantetheine-binding protein [Actinoplanes sp. NEAU-A12]|uniref:Phosphopantetheine-binding protein n=1 Tax=Actinoplanes sandaracinus TaxID=3045177 RepID=A0ABT6WPT4_9ACTN|nr:phosphopantetheine-binding protein [Actinoplanes sandaracinus]MDI6101728.1 phosphopantetheine-binding protein [Actinoplanes sandaracinus]